MKNLFLFLFTSLLTFALLQVAGISFVNYQSHRGNWIESPHSKMELLESTPAKFDYILLGTSTLQNHINSPLMNSLGLKVFNFGLPGRHWEEYPSLLQKLKREKADTLVISFSPMAFYRPVLCPAVFDIHNVSYLVRSGKWNCLWNYKISEIFPFNQELPVFGEGQRSEALFKSIEERHHVKLIGDPRGVNFARGKEYRYVITFKNGDGMVSSGGLSEDEEPFQHVSKKVSEMFPENLEYLRYLLSLIDSRGFKLVLVIEPRHFNHMVTFSEEDFQKAIGGKYRVIFNNNFRVQQKYWADLNHFNQEAVDYYTQLLACQLKAAPAFSEKLCRRYRDKLVNGI